MPNETELLRNFIDSSKAIIYLKDGDGRFLMVNGRAASVAGTTTVTVNVGNNKNGESAITIRATDTEGNFAEDTFELCIGFAGCGNISPTASATAASPIDENTSTLLVGTADDPDGDNDNMKFLWEITSGVGGSITPGTETLIDATFNAPNIGGPGADRDYVFTLTVTDEGGAESTTTVNLTVVNINP